MSHYYTKDPKSKHNRKLIKYEFRNKIIAFTTDTGVFCKDKVDYGTNLLLNALPEEITGEVLDLGCGWGAIGTTVRLHNPDCNITMCDINKRAVELALKNLHLNNLTGIVTESDGFEKLQGNYDYILLNPPIRAGKSVYFPWIDAGYKRLNNSGSMYLVIQKKQGAKSMKKELLRVFKTCETIARSDGYHVYKSTKQI